MLKTKKRFFVILIAISIVFGIDAIALANNQFDLQTTEMLENKLKVNIEEKDLKNSISKMDVYTENLDGNRNYEINASNIIFEIKQPKVFTISRAEAKNYGENYFKEEINFIAEKSNLPSDIDDAFFREKIKEYAFDDERLIELAKFIDTYENYDYNDFMEKLITDIESKEYSNLQELFTDENFNTLLSMMPLDPNDYPATVEDTSVNNSSANMMLSGYSGSRAREYAKEWAYKTNNTKYGYYAHYNKQPSPYNNDMWSGGTENNKRTWNDCANFVSQCLKAGGANYIKNGIWLPHQKDENWYYSDSKPSHSWGGASNFQKHWSKRVGTRSSSGDSKVGDPVSLDYNGDGLADHTVIITTVNSRASRDVLYAGHTSDQFEAKGKSLASLFDHYEKIWIFPLS